MRKEHNDPPVFSKHNKVRGREITEWVNRKLDEELEKLADEERFRLTEIAWSKWCSDRDEDQSGEALALRAAETGDLAPLRELYPRLAKYLNPPKTENRGGDRRTETEKREANEKYERARLALFEYRRIMKLLKDHQIKPTGPLAVKIAAARWTDFDDDSTTKGAEVLRHKFEAELERALHDPSRFDL